MADNQSILSVIFQHRSPPTPPKTQSSYFSTKNFKKLKQNCGFSEIFIHVFIYILINPGHVKFSQAKRGNE